MPTTRDESKDKINREVADAILQIKEPPVARFRLMSKGMEPYPPPLYCRIFVRDYRR